MRCSGRHQLRSQLASEKEAKKKLKTVILLISEVNFVAENNLYWHIEFISSWLGFIDDVEIYFDEIKSLIHVRSASRVGYWDFGTNRKRIEEIRFKFSSFPTKNEISTFFSAFFSVNHFPKFDNNLDSVEEYQF